MGVGGLTPSLQAQGGALTVKEDITESQIQTARKEIKANIRRQLNTSQLRSKLDDGLAHVMDSALKDAGHPINKLFALGRLDQSDIDHWRALTFLMAEEIFGLKSKGAPPKDDAPFKHLQLLVFLGIIHRIRTEDGLASGVAHAIADLPTFFDAFSRIPDIELIAQRYQKTRPSTLKDYAHGTLTEIEQFLRSQSEKPSPGQLEIFEEVLDNFRPNWRRSQP